LRCKTASPRYGNGSQSTARCKTVSAQWSEHAPILHYVQLLSAHCVRNMHPYFIMYSCVSHYAQNMQPSSYLDTHFIHDLTFPTKLTNEISNYTGRINSGNVYYFYLFIYWGLRNTAVTRGEFAVKLMKLKLQCPSNALGPSKGLKGVLINIHFRA
jgi:hypothetical protein